MAEILVAPFTNSAIRDWPTEHFSNLIGLLLDEFGGEGCVRVIGTPGQRLGACDVVRPYHSELVRNDCGRLPWSALLSALRGATCVIGNNSGIAHVAGFYGTPTVCVFGGSHERREWRPRGKYVVLVSRAIGCSPCQLDHGDTSPYNKACLRQIEPAVVLEAVKTVLKRATETASVDRKEV